MKSHYSIPCFYLSFCSSWFSLLSVCSPQVKALAEKVGPVGFTGSEDVRGDPAQRTIKATHRILNISTFHPVLNNVDHKQTYTCNHLNVILHEVYKSLTHHEKKKTIKRKKKHLQLRYQNPAWCASSWPSVQTVDRDINPTLLINVPVLAIGTHLSFTLTSVTSEAASFD